jgi:hypothetical protein
MDFKLVFVFGLFAYFCVEFVETRPQLPNIPREFQNINFEQYLRNERAMKFQLKCIIYNGPCDTIGKFIKRNIPIYLKTQCKNCDEEQKKLAGKFIKFLQENYPTEFDDAVAKYGKTEYSPEEVEAFEKELGIKIVRDKNAPTRAPGQKPNIDGLVALTKEAISAIVNTKAPIVLGKVGSATTIVVQKVTLSPQFAKFSTTEGSAGSSTREAAAPSSSSSTTETVTTEKESVTTETSKE